jgi:hypothetical protein
VMVCLESNIIDVPSNTWWLDTGATIHVTNSLQAVTSRRRPSRLEEYVYMGDNTKVRVEFFGTVNLQLNTGHFLELHDVAYLPSIRRNLISVSILDRLGYSLHFGTGKLTLYRDSMLIGNGTLCGNLYKLDLLDVVPVTSPSCPSSSSLNAVVGSKRARSDLKSSMLWHKRLGHISRDRMERLVKDGVLQDLDFFDFTACVDCIKGKLTAKVRKSKSDRSADVLELIHTDICGPFVPPAMGGYKYFITFIDDFSRYGHVELIREKSESLDAFKIFKTNVELQKGKKIKAVNSDRGGEYYGRYDETGRNPGPFAKYLLECGIDANIQCQGHPNKMELLKEGNAHFLTWYVVC